MVDATLIVASKHGYTIATFDKEIAKNSKNNSEIETLPVLI